MSTLFIYTIQFNEQLCLLHTNQQPFYTPIPYWALKKKKNGDRGKRKPTFRKLNGRIVMPSFGNMPCPKLAMRERVVVMM
jgi:hypothetical protein